MAVLAAIRHIFLYHPHWLPAHHTPPSTADNGSVLADVC